MVLCYLSAAVFSLLCLHSVICNKSPWLIWHFGEKGATLYVGCRGAIFLVQVERLPDILGGGYLGDQSQNNGAAPIKNSWWGGYTEVPVIDVILTC